MAADGSVTRAARGAPEVLIRAVGHAGPVLDPHSPRRVELDRAASESEATSELCRALELFALAHAVRVAALEVQKAQLAGLPVFDLLLYAGRYIFDRCSSNPARRARAKASGVCAPFTR
jgi:hypothetical protein